MTVSASLPQAIPLAALAELATSPYPAAASSPFEAQPWLLVDARTPASVATAAERQAVSAWLRRQPCPVLAIVGDTDACNDPWRADYDLLIESAAAAAPLLANIQRAPLAAMTLVQVLRATEHLPIAQGLLVESLAYATLQGGAEFRHWLATQHQPAPASTSDSASDSASEPAPADAEPPVLLDYVGTRLDIRLNRPARRNAFSVEMRDAVVEALQLVAADSHIESACVSGVGACFSIGGDLDEFGTAPDPASAHAIRSLRLPAATLQHCAARVDFQLHGACIGAGIELPAFGRHVTAARKTFFQLPEIRFGLIPGAGGCISIPRRIGRQRTAWLALSTRRIDAPTALAWGLVDALVS